MRAFGVFAVGSLFLGGCVAIAGISGYENVDDAGSTGADTRSEGDAELHDETSTTDSGTTDDALADGTLGDSSLSDGEADSAPADTGGSTDSGTLSDTLTATDSGPADTGFDAGSTWCSTHGITAPFSFCDDFDVPPFGARWDSSTNSGGSLQFGPPAASTPNAAISNMGIVGGRAGLLETIGSYSNIHVRLDLSVPGSSSGTNNFQPILYLDFSPDGTSGPVVGLALRPATNSLRAFTASSHSTSVSAGGVNFPTPANVFQQVDLTYSSCNLVVLVGGTSYGLAAPCTGPAHLWVGVDETFGGGLGTSGITVAYDDVEIDAH